MVDPSSSQRRTVGTETSPEETVLSSPERTTSEHIDLASARLPATDTAPNQTYSSYRSNLVDYTPNDIINTLSRAVIFGDLNSPTGRGDQIVWKREVQAIYHHWRSVLEARAAGQSIPESYDYPQLEQDVRILGVLLEKTASGATFFDLFASLAGKAKDLTFQDIQKAISMYSQTPGASSLFREFLDCVNGQMLPATSDITPLAAAYEPYTARFNTRSNTGKQELQKLFIHFAESLAEQRHFPTSMQFSLRDGQLSQVEAQQAVGYLRDALEYTYNPERRASLEKLYEVGRELSERFSRVASKDGSSRLLSLSDLKDPAAQIAERVLRDPSDRRHVVSTLIDAVESHVGGERDGKIMLHELLRYQEYLSGRQQEGTLTRALQVLQREANRLAGNNGKGFLDLAKSSQRDGNFFINGHFLLSKEDL